MLFFYLFVSSRWIPGKVFILFFGRSIFIYISMVMFNHWKQMFTFPKWGENNFHKIHVWYLNLPTFSHKNQPNVWYIYQSHGSVMGSKLQRFFSSAKMLKLQSWVLELENHHRIIPNKNPWILRIFQHTPDPQPTVYEGIPFIWGFIDSWGMLQGYVGVFLDGCVFWLVMFLHPGRLTWTLKMMALEDDFPFQLGNF